MDKHWLNLIIDPEQENRWRMAGKPKKCQICGKDFSSRTNKRYCDTCANRDFPPPAVGTEYKCKHCGETFIRSHPRQTYCSHKCRKDHVPQPSIRVGEQTTCKHCGKVFTLKVGNQKYCTKDCAREVLNKRSRLFGLAARQRKRDANIRKS